MSYLDHKIIMSYDDYYRFGQVVYNYLGERQLVMVARAGGGFAIIKQEDLAPGELVLSYDYIVDDRTAMKKLLTVGWKEAFEEEMDERAR